MSYSQFNRPVPKFNERRNHRGYDSPRNGFFKTQQRYAPYPQVAENDFIPFNTSRNHYQLGRPRNNYDWRTHNNSQRHYDGCPKKNINSFSPYNARARGGGRNKSFNSGWYRNIPMSQFLDIPSALEDPWKELVENMNTSSIKEDKKESENVAMDSDKSTGLNESQENKVIVQDHSNDKSIDSRLNR